MMRRKDILLVATSISLIKISITKTSDTINITITSITASSIIILISVTVGITRKGRRGDDSVKERSAKAQQ